MSGDLKGNCWQCGRELAGGEYGRMENCPGCSSDTKVCKNCAHYAPTLNNECRETAAEPVFDKTKVNFCEFFRPGRPAAAGEPGAETPAPGKSAFDALFKKKAE